MRRFGLALLVFTLALFPALKSHAESPEQAVRLVKSAAAFYQANGLEKTLDELSNAKGQFREGEVYVFAYDLTGSMLAHPNNSLIGHNLTDVPDPDGKYFRRDFIQTAMTKGSGWVDYKYQNPKTKAMDLKSTYVQKADDIIICCGIFKK
jgi:signal transduction histidine kinase